MFLGMLYCPRSGWADTLAGAWAGGTEYGVNFVLLNKFVCFVLCVTLLPFFFFCCVLCHGFSYDSSLIFARIIII
jgi:hypothetical protein